MSIDSGTVLSFPRLFLSLQTNKSPALLLPEYERLITQYGFLPTAPCTPPPSTGHALELNDDRLALHTFGAHAPGAVFVDFASGNQQWRLRNSGRKQPIARACGVKDKQALPRILDATAGLGGDAFVLASLGCQVDMLERSPIAAALLEDGLKRGALTNLREISDTIARMRLYYGDALALLSDWPHEQPDTIYLDPMFPHRAQQSALSKKNMQAFQQLIGEDEDADKLLALAKNLAKSRVVVKRPRHAPCLANLPASFCLEGRSVRFDVYVL